jgi:hypothetical protein
MTPRTDYITLTQSFNPGILRPGSILLGPSKSLMIRRDGCGVGPRIAGGSHPRIMPQGFGLNTCRGRTRWWAGVVPQAARSEENGDELNFSSGEVSRDDAEVAEVPVSTWSKESRYAIALQAGREPPS